MTEEFGEAGAVQMINPELGIRLEEKYLFPVRGKGGVHKIMLSINHTCCYCYFFFGLMQSSSRLASLV